MSEDQIIIDLDQTGNNQLILDGYGEPVLLAFGAPRTDKTGSSIALPVKSGNPFRDPGSGTFGNGPAGAKVDAASGSVLKQLSPQAALYLTQMKNKFAATDIKATEVNGRAKIILLKNGVQVGTLDLPVSKQGAGAPQSGAPVVSGARDSLVAKARENVGIEKLDGAARAQRIDDLVDYLYARYNATGAIFSKPGTVKVLMPEGMDQKTIGGLTDIELKDVTSRLGTLGWTNGAVKKILLANVKADRRNAIAGANKEATK